MVKHMMIKIWEIKETSFAVLGKTKNSWTNKFINNNLSFFFFFA